MTEIKWSILIPTVPARREMLRQMLRMLEPQLEACPYKDIELLVLEDNRKRDYGAKMQSMIDIAQGEYVCFVDDDDRVSNDYVSSFREAMEENRDCIGFMAQYSHNGFPGKNVKYSRETLVWNEDATTYYRNPQHLTPIKRGLVKRVPWEGHYGADHTWSHRMTKLGIIRTETFVPKILYYYDYMDTGREGVWK